MALNLDSGKDLYIANNEVVNTSRSFIIIGRGVNAIVIKNNLRYNTPDFNRYAVRNCSSDTSTLLYSYGNVKALESNIILGTVNYGGYNKKAADNAFYKDNIFIKSPRYKVLQNSDATDKGGNIWIESYRINNEKVFLPKEVYRKVLNDRNMDTWVKKYVGELK